MDNNELFEQARKRVQKNIKHRSVTNKEVIIEQEKEILYYRKRIEKMMKNTESRDNEIKPLKDVTSEINNLTCACDTGQAKDYTIINYYKNGELIKTETIQYK